jgi:hypothetical protein
MFLGKYNPDFWFTMPMTADFYIRWMYSKYYRIVKSKINILLGSVAIAVQKLAGHPVERRTVANAKNIMNIMLVHEHDLVPATMNQMKSFRCNTCGTIYCQICGKSIIPMAARNHKIVCMTK